MKAARLATLGALETKGLSEYQFVAGAGGSGANRSSPLPFLGTHSVEQRVVLHKRHKNGWCCDVSVTLRVRAARIG